MHRFIQCQYLFLFVFLTATSFGRPDDTLTDEGKASYYHDLFQGLETSSGDIYNQEDFTAAHRTLPFNTIVHVTNKLNNKSIVVRINDRGPFKRSRIIDLTRSAAQKIGMVPYGVVPVKIHVLNLLDQLPMHDSLLKENEAWDCYGNKKTPEGISVYIWKTEYWKHAFYMASDLVVDYQLDSVLVKPLGSSRKRHYVLFISGLKNKSEATRMVNKLKKDGFRTAHLIK